MIPFLHGHFSYLILVIIFLVLPTIVFWIYGYKQLLEYKWTLSIITGISLIVGAKWDIYAVETEIWKFYPETTLGTFYRGVPLEEYLFVVMAAFCLASLTIILVKKKKYV